MALTIEDGSLVTGAQSYVTAAEYNAYLDLRYPSRTAITDDVAEGYIMRAMDYFENLRFIGLKFSENQSLQWPRAGVWIDGFSVEDNEIPLLVKEAVYELAYGFEQGYGISDPVSRETTSEKVGDLSVTYKTGAAARTLTPAVNDKIRKITCAQNRVRRA